MSSRWQNRFLSMLLLTMFNVFGYFMESSQVLPLNVSFLVPPANTTKEPMLAEESHKNYLAQYPQPNSNPFGYHEGLNVPFDDRKLLVKLAQRGNAANDDHSAGGDKDDEEDSHYRPTYSEDTPGSTKGHYVGRVSRYRTKSAHEEEKQAEFKIPPRRRYIKRPGKAFFCSRCPCDCESDSQIVQRSYIKKNGNEEGQEEEGEDGGGDNGYEQSTAHGKDDDFDSDNEEQAKYGAPDAPMNPETSCNFARSDCGFKNDKYEDSLFRHGYSDHFEAKLWFIDHAHSQSSSNGWGRLISPHFSVPKGHYDACMLIEFEFDSEGKDHLTVHIQENDNTRIILDYMHERPGEKESLMLRKYVHFVVTGTSIRFFIQFQFDTDDSSSEYGLRTFELFFDRCPQADKMAKTPLHSDYLLKFYNQ